MLSDKMPSSADEPKIEWDFPNKNQEMKGIFFFDIRNYLTLFDHKLEQLYCILNRQRRSSDEKFIFNSIPCKAARTAGRIISS